MGPVSCPTPAKSGYADARTARTEATRIRADKRGSALIPYQCPCGSWHLKSRDNLAARVAAALKEN